MPNESNGNGRRLLVSFAGPAFTVVAGLVFAVFDPLVASVAVTVFVEPAIALNVTLNVCVPEASAAFDGSVALTSLEVIPTVSVELTTFQAGSTALTVTVNAVPAACALGLPVFPAAVPSAVVSPGIKS